MTSFKKIISVLIIACIMQSCIIVRPGEGGVDIHYGKIKQRILLPGPHHHFAIIGKKVVRFNTKEINYSVAIDFHTKEGIDVKSEITILYHLDIDSLVSIYRKYGTDYQDVLIKDNIITALRQTGLKFNATELITQRAEIEKMIIERLNEKVGSQGFVMHSVMLKQIDLPPDIEQTIRAQLNAVETAKKVILENEVKRQQLAFDLEKSKKEKLQEIENQRIALDFILEKQQKENERLLIEASAFYERSQLISSKINNDFLRYKGLDVTKEIIKSPNSKIIVTNGKSPIIVDSDN